MNCKWPSSIAMLNYVKLPEGNGCGLQNCPVLDFPKDGHSLLSCRQGLSAGHCCSLPQFPTWKVAWILTQLMAIMVKIMIQHEFWMILGVPLEPASWNSCSCIWTCLGERFPVNSSLKNPGIGWVMMAILSAVPPIVIHFGNHLKCSSWKYWNSPSALVQTAPCDGLLDFGGLHTQRSKQAEDIWRLTLLDELCLLSHYLQCQRSAGILLKVRSRSANL